MTGKRMLILLCAMWVMVLCCSAVAWARGWSSDEFKLPPIDGVAFWPRVSGNWAVALMNTDPNNIHSTVGVLCYDLANRQVCTVYRGTAVSPHSHAISGNLVVWSGMSDNIDSLRGTMGGRGRWSSSLILYDLSTGRYWAPELLTKSALMISISGKYVAYEKGSRIYLYDVTTGAQKQISDDRPQHNAPDIGGDLVVWREFTDPSSRQSSRPRSRILGYRISTGTTFECPNSEGVNSGPATDGSVIAWGTSGGAKVYDPKAGTERTILNAQYPDVSNGVVVYLKSLPGSTKRAVYGTDLSMRGEFRVSRGTADRPPSIDNRHVVWAKGDTVYCAEITKKP